MATVSTSIWDSFNSTVSSAFNTASLAVAKITPLAVSVAETKAKLAALKNPPVGATTQEVFDYNRGVATGNMPPDSSKGGFDTTTLIIGGLGILALIMLRRGGA